MCEKGDAGETFLVKVFDLCWYWDTLGYLATRPRTERGLRQKKNMRGRRKLLHISVSYFELFHNFMKKVMKFAIQQILKASK